MDLELIGKGNERLVLKHPEEPQKIIKLNHNQISARSQNEIEALYFDHLRQKKINSMHLPRYFGKISIEEKTGLIFEKIENDDGSPAMHLDELLRKNILTRPEIRDLLNQLYLDMLKNNIVFADVSPANIVCKKNRDGSFTFVVIDGIGSRHKSFKLWLYMHVGIYAKYKMHKQFNLLLNIVERFFARNNKADNIV